MSQSRVLLLLILLGVASPSRGDSEIAAQAREVLKHHCLRCHSGKGSASGYDFDMRLSAGLKGEFELVKPKDAENSKLLTVVLENEMPPRSIPQRPSEDEKEILKKWIAAGAPDFPEAQGREYIKLETVLTAVRDYLRERGSEDRPFLRFFTIHNLHNNPKILDKDLRIYRAALSKAANSLSQKSRITLPVAIDRTPALAGDRQGSLKNTVYVLDIRDFGWDERGMWEKVLSRYPYGLSYSNLPDNRLQKLSSDLEELTGSDISLIRADWFVTNATRPPLYHELLGIPATADELERQLGVNIRKNFSDPAPSRIARAGFAKSGISSQNRLLERSDSREGMYWKSYDFKPGAGRQKLTRFPLGPRNLFAAGQHPFDSQAFVHAGGEIIWRLPNGLQAYMLTDGEGQRIDTGPIEIVHDKLESSGNPAIVNGVSCMACHGEGIKSFTDTIRDHSAVFGDAEKRVKDLYLPADEMNKIVEEDQEVFMRALKKCCGPYLQVEEDKNKPIEEFVEPVGEVSRWHQLVFLDLPTIASELDIKDAQKELLNIVGQRKLKQLGLESLLEKDGVISRGEWEALDGPSLMQELARELRYTPNRPLAN